MGDTWIIILASCIKSIPIGLNIVALYAYYKLQILKKPPGELIFIQLIIFLIMQANVFINLIQTITSGSSSNCISTDYIPTAAYTACILYELCIAFEVFMRVRSAFIGQNYSLRRFLYHSFSFGGSLALMMMGIFSPNCTDEFKLQAPSIEHPLLVVYSLLVFLAFALLISSLIYMKHVKNEVKLKHLRSNFLYLCIFLMLIGIIFAGWIVETYEEGNKSEGTDFLTNYRYTSILLLARIFCEIGIFLVKLWEPGVRKFLKDKFKRSRKRIAVYARRVSSFAGNDTPSNYLNYTDLIDELKQETIEYQLIAISIIIFDNYSKTPSIRNFKEYTLCSSTIEEYATVNKWIRAYNLEILCDTQISQKYTDYYCEYKLYDFYAFKNIIADDGLEANGIANSLSVTENLQRIIRYISEEGSDLLLNFVTFDERFVVKALSKKELKIFLKEKLEGYYDRVMDNSFLQHIYGIFKLTIKGQDYSIAVLENNPEGFISRGSISINSTGRGVELILAGEPDQYNKFNLDSDMTAHFKEALKKDLEYLYTSKIFSCKIFIDIVGEPPQGSRKVYSGIYQGKSSYLSVRIYDVFYTGKCLKSKRLASNGIQDQFHLGTLSKIESMLETYIRF